MSLTEALTVHQATLPVLGILRVDPPSPCSCMSEAEAIWGHYVDQLAEGAKKIESLGGKVLANRANCLFFESPVEIGGAEHFDDPGSFQDEMEDTPDVSMDVKDSGGAMEGFEISGEDWCHVEALGKGDQPDIDQATGEWLAEVGLIQKSSEGWALTSFGKDWLRVSVDN